MGRETQYVQQEDNLIPILTVQQTFEVMAMFYSTDMKVVKDRSERAIAMLGLEKQRDTIIGARARCCRVTCCGISYIKSQVECYEPACFGLLNVCAQWLGRRFRTHGSVFLWLSYCYNFILSRIPREAYTYHNSPMGVFCMCAHMFSNWCPNYS